MWRILLLIELPTGRILSLCLDDRLWSMWCLRSKRGEQRSLKMLKEIRQQRDETLKWPALVWEVGIFEDAVFLSSRLVRAYGLLLLSRLIQIGYRGDVNRGYLSFLRSSAKANNADRLDRRGREVGVGRVRYVVA